MNYKELLENLGLVEGVDFTLTESSFEMVIKSRQVEQSIEHPSVVEIPAVLDEQGNEISPLVPAVEAYTETILVEESYTEPRPSAEVLEQLHKQLEVAKSDIAMLIEEYLKDKSDLRDSENDSINIVNNQIHTWNFTNILQPTLDELFNLIPSVQVSKNTQDILAEIVELEKQITPRKVREALLSNNYTFIQTIENQITALREQL